MSPESKQIPEKPHVTREVIPEVKLKSPQYYEKLAREIDRRFQGFDPGRSVYRHGDKSVKKLPCP